MIISRRSLLTGKKSEMDLPVTREQIELWQSGILIQNVMPELTNVQREFLISGMSPEEQKKIFKIY